MTTNFLHFEIRKTTFVQTRQLARKSLFSKETRLSSKKDEHDLDLNEVSDIMLLQSKMTENETKMLQYIDEQRKTTIAMQEVIEHLSVKDIENEQRISNIPSFDSNSESLINSPPPLVNAVTRLSAASKELLENVVERLSDLEEEKEIKKRRSTQQLRGVQKSKKKKKSKGNKLKKLKAMKKSKGIRDTEKESQNRITNVVKDFEMKARVG